MSKKRMLADVLWEAANEHLRAHDNDYGKSHYTCDSIRAASRYQPTSCEFAMKFLRKLGLPRDARDRYDLFNAFSEVDERQGVRYMWLLLAMHVAEDEGIEL